jgi:uncharacterized membrane protein
MSGPALYVRATVKGHPIHPMLVGLPIGFYTAGTVALVVLGATGEEFWQRAAMIALAAGAACGAVAAVFGMIDLFGGVPPRTPARVTGVRHFGANALSLVLFASAAVMLWGDRHGHPTQAHHAWIAPLVLALIGFVLTAIAGGLGFKLVQTHHVAISGTTDAPTPTRRI